MAGAVSQWVDGAQIDRMLGDAIQSVNGWSQSWDSACNVFEDEQSFMVQMALPGRRANEVDVQVENNMLRVKGEWKRDEPKDRRWYMGGKYVHRLIRAA